MLLMLYERAIDAIECCSIAHESGDMTAFRKHEMNVRKAIMTIHAGLKPEESDVAFNIARILHYVMVQFDQKDFATCSRLLGQIRDGFAQIADEANALEQTGEIPKMPERDTFESIA